MLRLPDYGPGRLALAWGGALSRPRTRILLKDTFADADGTALAAHAMDVGPGWTVDSGVWTIESGRATNGDGGIAYADAGKKDYTVTGTVQENGGGLTGFAVRLTDGNNFWLAGIGSDQVTIYSVVGAGFTLRATAAGTINTATDYTLKVTVSGTKITATANGITCEYDAMGTNLTATRVGLRKGGATGTDQFDNFQVTG